MTKEKVMAVLMVGAVFLFLIPASSLGKPGLEPKSLPPQVKLPRFHTPKIKSPLPCPSASGSCRGKCFPVKVRGDAKCVTCPRGFAALLYNGEKMCVKCSPGFRYVEYNGVNMCVKCPSGYIYAKYRGRDMCVKCTRGYTYLYSSRGGMCFGCDKGYLFKVRKGKGFCRKM